ncbi:MAG: nicotinate (nicotinamide) nucleotide adenylyltransferase [Acidobacteriales bacterium]|nr:nicotinate (nicotinamide) nucleotide adenylyltransferase [Terriglobales bacterium]
MNIGLFGGTFDPIHRGHIALAAAAREKFDLGRILLVPTNLPPHRHEPNASYFHRYAMVALASAGDKTLIPSLLEAPGTGTVAGKPTKPALAPVNYSIDTVRRLKRELKKSDRLFFLIGIDAFREIALWHEAVALLRECEFVVASRPGFSLADVANSLPEAIRPAAHVTKPFAKAAAVGDLILTGATVRMLEGVNVPVSSTAVRQSVASRKPIAKFVGDPVADYIKKIGLYSG